MFPVHDSRLFIGCAGSILVHINYWWGWEEGSRGGGCGSHASQAGSFEPGMRLCEPAVHIMVAVSQNSPTEWGCWCDYRFSHKYQQHLWKTCIWSRSLVMKTRLLDWLYYRSEQQDRPAVRTSSESNIMNPFLIQFLTHVAYRRRLPQPWKCVSSPKVLSLSQALVDARAWHSGGRTDRQTGMRWMLRRLSLLLCGLFFPPGKPFQCFTQIKMELILSLFRNLTTS